MHRRFTNRMNVLTDKMALEMLSCCLYITKVQSKTESIIFRDVMLADLL